MGWYVNGRRVPLPSGLICSINGHELPNVKFAAVQGASVEYFDVIPFPDMVLEVDDRAVVVARLSIRFTAMGIRAARVNWGIELSSRPVELTAVGS